MDRGLVVRPGGGVRGAVPDEPGHVLVPAPPAVLARPSQPRPPAGSQPLPPDGAALQPLAQRFPPSCAPSPWQRHPDAEDGQQRPAHPSHLRPVHLPAEVPGESVPLARPQRRHGVRYGRDYGDGRGHLHQRHLHKASQALRPRRLRVDRPHRPRLLPRDGDPDVRGLPRRGLRRPREWA